MEVQVLSTAPNVLSVNAMRIPTIASSSLKLVPLSFDHSTAMFDMWSDEAVAKYTINNAHRPLWGQIFEGQVGSY